MIDEYGYEDIGMEVIELSDNEVNLYSEFHAKLEILKRDNKIVFDYTSEKGIKEVKSYTYKIRKLKSALEAARKEAKAKALEYGRYVDSQAKSIASDLEAMIELHDKPLREIAAKKAAEAEAIRIKLEFLGSFYAMDYSIINSSEIKSYLDSLSNFVIDDSLGDFQEKAKEKKKGVLEILSNRLEASEKYENDQRKLEELIKAAAEAEAEKKAWTLRERLQQVELDKARREKVAADLRAERLAKDAVYRAEEEGCRPISCESHEHKDVVEGYRVFNLKNPVVIPEGSEIVDINSVISTYAVPYSRVECRGSVPLRQEKVILSEVFNSGNINEIEDAVITALQESGVTWCGSDYIPTCDFRVTVELLDEVG